MNELGVSLLSLAVMVGSFWTGAIVQRFLREMHRSRESVESIRVVITLLVTFAAVVLGLLISSTQARFTSLGTSLRGLSIDIIELDQRLREYGPEVDAIRANLILYTKAAIADTWPEETPPPGDYPRQLNPVMHGSIESVELSRVLSEIDLGVHRLTPQDDFQRSMATSILTRVTAFLDRRWEVIENAQASLSWPFVAILLFWLAVIFFIAGLSSPRNFVVFTVTTLAALSLASSIYLALELDTPVSGYIKISSRPLRDALGHITQPPLPAGAP